MNEHGRSGADCLRWWTIDPGIPRDTNQHDGQRHGDLDRPLLLVAAPQRVGLSSALLSFRAS